MKKITKLLCAATLLSFAHLSQAQISITGSLPQNYSQDFDTLGTNDVAWVNESTIPGWLFVTSTNGVDAGPVSTLTESDGTGAFATAFNFGTISDPERSLGSRAFTFAVTTEAFYGARFINNSDGTITNVNISYTGEQWRDNNTNSQTIAFFHRVGGSDFLGDPSNTGWTAIPSLDFISPQNAAVGILDGNDPTNRVAISSAISVNIAPGEEFWIRWADTVDTVLNDHFLGIDDFNITFNGINPPPLLSGVTIDLKKPKPGKKLKFKGSKGFKVKGNITSTSNTVSQASYAAFGGTNAPTNLTFITADFKPLTKGKLFKKGVDATFQSTKTTKAGVSITTAPVTLLVRVVGGSNNASQVTFTNVFTDAKIK